VNLDENMSAFIVVISMLYVIGSALLLACIVSGKGDPLPPTKANREIQ
jgi:hypothetical protein